MNKLLIPKQEEELHMRKKGGAQLEGRFVAQRISFPLILGETQVISF